ALDRDPGKPGLDAGGNGGAFGGGGGGMDEAAGYGGFGGGGGGGATDYDGDAGGTGGFGAGGGGGGEGGTGGTYGGTGGSGEGAAGGGGAGLGGAIFVRDGGKLTIKDGGFTGPYGVSGGTTTGEGGAPGGEAHGDVMFIHGGSTSAVFEVSTDNIVTIDTSDGELYDAEVGGIAGAGGIEKTGAGLLRLFGAHTYQGLTKVSDGTLEIRGSLASAISVNDGGVFAGSGEVSGIKVGEGILTPGNVALRASRPEPLASIGTLASGGLTLGVLATYMVEVAYDRDALVNDQIVVAGAVRIDGALSLSVLGDFDVDEGTFTIIDNDGIDAVEGMFDGLAEGADFDSGGLTFRISYTGGDGNDVTLTVAPRDVDPPPPTPGVVVRGTNRNDKLDSTHTPKGQPFAGKGDDTIFGGGGDDRIHGHAGDDTIIGGVGADRMWGDAGEDTFVFRSLADVGGSLKFRGGTSASDHILGFVRGEDRIDLTRFDASTAKGFQNFTFIGKQGFQGEAGELRYTANGAKTVVLSGDVNGDGRADFNIVVHGANALDPGDLILI
ncbi:MAG TPA: autotransporter-associated beta strand repeat-containing protein, partial [Bauldia sp.]|nr:autotransporter-associated beta strand repeat-containing protein [Bauldia sp.]